MTDLTVPTTLPGMPKFSNALAEPIVEHIVTDLRQPAAGTDGDLRQRYRYGSRSANSQPRSSARHQLVGLSIAFSSVTI